ncbi:MAG: hypothetical protein UT50_C0026G0001, partial [Candidatus Moranbacteria bacterium GW2011_GWA2_39_41]
FLIFDRLIVRILGFLFEKSKGLIIRFLNEVSRSLTSRLPKNKKSSIFQEDFLQNYFQ